MRGHIGARRGPRGVSHQIVVYAGVDERGRRRCVRETIDGSKGDAERRLSQFIAAVDTGQAGASSHARVSEVVDAWWEASTGHLSPSTRVGYRGMLRRYMLPTLGSRRIDKVKPLRPRALGRSPRRRHRRHIVAAALAVVGAQSPPRPLCVPHVKRCAHDRCGYAEARGTRELSCRRADARSVDVGEHEVRPEDPQFLTLSAPLPDAPPVMIAFLHENDGRASPRSLPVGPMRHRARGVLITWFMLTIRHRSVLVVAAVGLTAVLGFPAAGVGVVAKALKPCSVLAPEDLQPIFEQPFRKGVQDDGGNCVFRRPQLLKKPDIVVSVMPERFASVQRAKKAFAKAKSLTTELAGQVQDVASGNDAFYALLIGTDLLTMRVGRVVVSTRVENRNNGQATYHDQVIAVSRAVAARLAAKG